ncbi:MAG TPA: flagellar filament capping protein FliD [Terracidiphilus sp.]
MSSISSALSSLLGSSNSSSSIDLSSILEAAFGASSSGIDVQAAVSSAVTAAEAPQNQWQTQLNTLQSQTSDINQIQSDVSNLDNDMQALNSITGPLSAASVTSSNSTVVTASAAPGSIQANHVVVVNSLAKTDSWTSNVYASSTTALPAGSFTVTGGGGASATITTDGTETLSDVANQINGDSLGVTASVITDASGARLALVANSSGSANDLTVTGDTGFGFAENQPGANASLTVDGINIASASNTVTGVIPGVTLNLLGTSQSEVSLSVQPDTSQASSAINQFVTDYNKVISDLNTEFTFTTGSGQGVLASDSTIRSLQTSVLSMLDYSAPGNTSVPNLSSLGITVNNDGTLSVDSATLTSTLQNNFSGVQNFFQGTSLNGFANSLDQQLTSFTDPSNGAFTLDLQSISSQETDLQTDISNFQTNYIQPLQTQLQSEYSQAEILLQELPNEMKQISAELGQNNSNG